MVNPQKLGAKQRQMRERLTLKLFKEARRRVMAAMSAELRERHAPTTRVPMNPKILVHNIHADALRIIPLPDLDPALHRLIAHGAYRNNYFTTTDGWVYHECGVHVWPLPLGQTKETPERRARLLKEYTLRARTK